MAGIRISDMTEAPEAQEDDYLEISRFNTTTAQWETFRVSTAAVASVGGEPVMANEVRLFVGEVPAGWEKIATQPQALPQNAWLVTEQGDVGSNDVPRVFYAPAINKLVSMHVNNGNVQVIEPGPDGNITNQITTVIPTNSNFDFPVSALYDDGQRAFWVGGYSTPYDDYAYEVDLVLGTSTRKADAPTSIYTTRITSMVNLGGDVFLVSHTDSDGSGNQVHIYTASTNAWSVAPNRPSGAAGGILTTLPDGRVLAATGLLGGSSGTMVGDCEIYDPASDSWETVSGLDASYFTNSVTTTWLRDHGAGVWLANAQRVAVPLGGAVGLYDPVLDQWAYIESNTNQTFSNYFGLITSVWTVDGGVTLNAAAYLQSAGPVYQTRTVIDLTAFLQSQVFYARYVGE